MAGASILTINEIRMEAGLLTELSNLSIGAFSVASLVYVTMRFTDTMDKRSERHEQAMQEREEALREVEREVRTNILDKLSQNTIAFQENTKFLERVMFQENRRK